MWHPLWWLLGAFWSMAQFQTATTCYTGFNSDGVTSPLGDIYLQSGSELVINCTLNENATGNSDARNITWLKEKKELPSHFISVLDTRTAQLRIPFVDKDVCKTFACHLKPNTTLCVNTVRVGNAPPKYDANGFKCISYKWQLLNCTWRMPPNCVHTYWTLHYKIGSGQVKCPEIREIVKNEFYSGIFSVTSYPAYDPLLPIFEMSLRGENKFGISTSNFSIRHSDIIIPWTPANLTVGFRSSTELHVQWLVGDNEKADVFEKLYPVVYWLEYKSQWDAFNHWKEIKNIESKSYNLSNLTPYTNYTIRVRSRSITAFDVIEMWSEPNEMMQSTLGTVPIAAVKTSSWSFEDVNVDIDKRNIIIFWQPVQPSEYFGPDFHYVIEVLDEDQIVQKGSAKASSFMASFSSLKQDRFYYFKIKVVNKHGESAHVREVLVPPESSKPPDPDGFSAVLHSSGNYKVMWNNSLNAEPNTITSFTVFWCKMYHGMCSTPLRWIDVDSNNKSVEVFVEDSTEMYKFAVSVNGVNMSSGLTWLKCISYYDGVLSKVKTLRVFVEGPRSAKVTWSLDCTDRMGIVTGFVIQYCLCRESNRQCQDGGSKLIYINESQVDSYTLNNLKPHSNYCITVAARHGQQVGERCNHKVVQTSEAEPDDPPQNVKILKVTNHSIDLQWNSPTKPNGVVNKSEIYYGSRRMELPCHQYPCFASLTNGIDPYTNYSIAVKSCTSKGCSPSSNSSFVTTDVGVPGQSDPPKLSWINETHVMVDWEEPIKPNGPISEWNLLIITENSGDEHNSTKVLQSHSAIVAIHCGDDGNTRYHFAVKAIIHNDDNESFIGPYSNLQSLNQCYRGFLGFSVAQLSGIAVGAGFAILFLLIGLFLFIRFFRAQFQKWRKVKVDLPPGLTEGNLGYSGFKKNHIRPSPYCLTENPKSILISDRLQSVSSDAGRCSLDSGKPILHTTSSLSSLHEEILFSEKTDLDGFGHQHNLSSDSSGCSTGAGSVSSAATTRIHLSCDSGTEADFPSPRFMPDSVFLESPPWPAPHIPTVAPNCQLRLRNSNILQRLGEESASDASGIANCSKELDSQGVEKTTVEPVMKDDIAEVDLGSHYCKAAGIKSFAATHPTAQSYPPCPAASESVSNDRAVLGPYYSQVGLSLPAQASGQNCASKSPGQMLQKHSDIAAQSPLTKRTKKASEVLSSAMHGADTREDDQSKESLSTPYVTVLSEPITPSRKLCFGYSKVGCTSTTSEDSQQPYTLNYGMDQSESAGTELPNQKKILQKPKDDNLLRSSAPNIGYVTVGKMDESVQNKYKETAKNLEVAREPWDEGLNFSLIDELSGCQIDDGRSSWENELEDVTDDDLRSFSVDVPPAVPQRGYVCLGSAKPQPSQSYVMMATMPDLIAQCDLESHVGNIGQEVDLDSNKPYLKVV